jgi:DNA-directed RNA polymerase II subunit RPB2
MDFRWDIIKGRARDVSLTQQALHSFDDFILRAVPEIVAHKNTIEVSSQLVENGPKHILKFSNPTYMDPSVVEKNQDVRPLTPNEARVRDLTFSAPMYVDVQYTYNKKVQKFVKLYIGRMPIMVRSTLGKVTEKFTECEHDPGGYMIINGNEKVVIVQQRVIPNIILCFKHQNGVQATVHSCSNQWTNSYCALKMTGGGLVPPKVEFSGLVSPVPILTFLRALGWGFVFIKKRLKLSEEEWDLWSKDSGFGIDATVEICMDWVLSRMKNKKTPKRSFVYVVYPHVGRSDDFAANIPMRKDLAMEQAKSLVMAFRGKRRLDTKDQLTNKRFDTAGGMMGALFATTWDKYIDEITMVIQKSCDKNKTIRPDKLVSTTTITDGLKYALATGNWKTKDATTGRVGVSQSLSRAAFISCISQLRRVDSNIESEQKMIPPRKLYGDQWGFLCPNETPEGQPTGLVYQMALTAQISTSSKNPNLFSTTKFHKRGKIPVYHNGLPVGRVSDGMKTCDDIKELRRNRLLALDLSVVFLNDSVHVWTDAGRIYRPVLVVEDGKLKMTQDIVNDLKKERTRFNDLYQLGVVENVDASETHNAFIALTPGDITPFHSHCELHPSMIFGTLVSCSPFADMNPGPRNTYQAAMGKQAMGCYISTYLGRFDTTGNVLDYVQKPLCVTKASITLGQNEMPSGFNAIVACMCDEGYNQEDSTQWNKASIDRGMGRSTTYQTVTTSTVARGTGYHRFERPKNTNTKNMRDEKLYNCLDDDGLPPPGTEIESGQAVIGRITCPREAEMLKQKGDLTAATMQVPNILSRDASLFHKKSNGVVDETIVFQNDQGGKTAKVRMRVQKIPELGDKFAVSTVRQT